MANGRLGSVVLGPIETAKVYTNTSGNAAAVSVVAKTLSATNDASMTIKLDSADVTPQTSSVISANSYGPETIFLDAAPDYSSLLGTYKFTNGTATYTKLSDLTTANISDYRNSMDIVPDSSSYFTAPYAPITFSNTTYFYTKNTYFGTTVADMRKSNIGNTSAPAGAASSTTMSYQDSGVVHDIYSALSISIGVNSNAYMSGTGYSSSGPVNDSKTTNSLYYNYAKTSSNTPSQWQANLYLTGGLLIAWDSFSNGRGAFRFYNRNETNTQVVGQISDNNHNTYTWGFQYLPSATSSYGTIAFLAYNPTTNKHYVMMRNEANSKYAYYRINTEIAIGRIGTGGGALSGYSTINAINSGAGGTLFEEISVPSSWNTASTVWPRIFKVLSPGKWMLREYDGTTWNTWITTDLENWTKQSATDYYTKVVSNTQLLKSDASQLIYTQSNISSVADSGTLELNTSFNSYERTGLVLSNGDNIYVKNDSATESIAVNVMGYEG